MHGEPGGFEVPCVCSSGPADNSDVFHDRVLTLLRNYQTHKIKHYKTTYCSLAGVILKKKPECITHQHCQSNASAIVSAFKKPYHLNFSPNIPKCSLSAVVTEQG